MSTESFEAKIEFIQKIANEVCEGCGPDRDCGLEYEECNRISNSIFILNDFLMDFFWKENNNHIL